MNDSVYPYLLKPKAVFPIWGSPDWSLLDGLDPEGLSGAGELWLNDDREGGARIANGPLAGWSLKRLLAEYPEPVLGPDQAPTGRLPVLLKFINPAKWLSVQVHPDEGPARSKYEAWHILAAPQGAEIVLGTRPGIGPEKLARAVAAGKVPEVIRFAGVAPGESYFIPAGLVHALGPGVFLFEIQQNADITYRFYDWDRLDAEGNPRPLHIRPALAAFRPDLAGISAVAPLRTEVPGGTRAYLTGCRHFLLTRLDLTGPHQTTTDDRHPIHLTCLAGSGTVSGNGRETAFGPGRTVLLPAALGDCEIIPDGRLTVLESLAPDLDLDLIEPLTRAGYSRSEIAALAGPLGERELFGKIQPE